jgi:hypothetical protein
METLLVSGQDPTPDGEGALTPRKSFIFNLEPGSEAAPFQSNSCFFGGASFLVQLQAA